MIQIEKYKVIISVFVLLHNFAYSYIDPGSLNAIWQFIAALIVGLISGFSFIRIKIKDFFTKLFRKKK